MTWLTAWPVLLVCFIASVFGIVQFVWPLVRKVTRRHLQQAVLTASGQLDAANLSRALSQITEGQQSSPAPRYAAGALSADGLSQDEAYAVQYIDRMIMPQPDVQRARESFPLYPGGL
jgi:hypothetical protein